MKKMKKMKKMGKCALSTLLFGALLSLAVLGGTNAAFASNGLNVTRLLFVDDVTGLSQFTPKQGSRFAVGDMCMIYMETTGFVLSPTAPGSEDEFTLDLAVDLAIQTPQRRRTIASENNFNTLKTTVRSKLSSTYLAFGFVFDEDWVPGNYIMGLTLRDNLSGESVAQEMVFQLDEPTDADLARQAEEDNAQ